MATILLPLLGLRRLSGLLLFWLLLLLLLELLPLLGRLLLQLMLLLLLLLLPTLESTASLAHPFSSWTRTSTTGRLCTSGVQGTLIYLSQHAPCLRNHIILYRIVGLHVTDDGIDIGRGMEVREIIDLPLDRLQIRNIVDYVTVRFPCTLTAAQHSHLLRYLVYPS